MKTHTLLRNFLTAVNLAAALALLPPHTRAEDKPQSPPNTTPVSAESAPPEYDLVIIGGMVVQRGTNKSQMPATLGNVVDDLRGRYPNADIVLSPGLANLKIIGDLKLRSGGLEEKLEAIRVASGEKFDVRVQGSAGRGFRGGFGERVDPLTGLPANKGDLFILREGKPKPENARTVEAFNIDAYLQWVRNKRDGSETKERFEKEVAERLNMLEDIVAKALHSLKQDDTTVEMPSFQFHRGANVLVVVGTREAVDVAGKVISALPGPVGFPNFKSGGGSIGVAPELSKDDAELRKRYGLPPAQPPDPKPPR